jgi:hypothetical protein
MKELIVCGLFLHRLEPVVIVKMSEIDDDDSPPVTTIRALVSTKEAGVIIGKSGKNVKEIRELSGARVNISEMIPGAVERVLTVVGPLDAVAKVCSFTSCLSLELGIFLSISWARSSLMTAQVCSTLLGVLFDCQNNNCRAS